MSDKSRKAGGDIFIVDNSDEYWKVAQYLQEWTQIARCFDEEQDLHGLQEKRLDREAIAGEDLGFVMRHPLSPTGRWHSRWRGGNAVPFQDRGNRLRADVIP